MSLCRSFSNPPVACLARDKCRCRFFATIQLSLSLFHFKLQAEEDRRRGNAHWLRSVANKKAIEFSIPHAGTYVQGQSSTKQNGLPAFSPQHRS